jgi:hypothetical protein
MEFVMNGIHSAVIAAIIVTASLASNLLAIATVGPARTGTGTLARVRLGLRRSPRHVKRLVDIWVAAVLARREQQAANWASHRLHGHELGGASLRDVRTGPGRPR